MLKLINPKKLDFAKTNFFKIDFLIFETKKTFIDLQKAFTKILILRHLIQNFIFYLRLMF